MLKQQISILGCGWLGSALAVELIENKHQVYGSTTSDNKSEDIRGLTPFIIDISKEDNDYSIFLSSNILIISIPPKNITYFKNLIDEIEKSDIKKVVFISSTSVYTNSNCIVTEETKTNNSNLADIEKLFITSPYFETTIIRFGGLFGYDRKPGNFIKSNKEIQNPEGYVNLIHRDDCIHIIEQIIGKNTWNEIINACADSHPTRREFYTKKALELGKDIIKFDEQSENYYKIVSSQKLKSLLNYEFKYADLLRDK